MTLIALDAGHGNDTYERTGGKGVPGLEEHDFNSAVVKVTKELLEYNGFDVLLTQPLNAEEVTLRDRTDLANAKQADILLSFHADANANKSARGHWAFYWHTSARGKELADIWSEELSGSTGTVHRGNRKSEPGSWTNFHMVRETAMPAVLMEHGFMTNVSDLKLLQSNEFRKQCGVSAAKAVCRYFGTEYKEKEIPSDVSEWAVEAYDWAVSNGISDGSNPKQPVTREQVWTMLYRAFGKR